MIFDILRSTITIAKWQDAKGKTSIGFEVVPNGQSYIDVGEEYILCAAGYVQMYGKGRKPIDASITVTSDIEQISHVKSESPIVGYAQFFPARQRDLYPQPAKLAMVVVVEPERFAELLSLRVTQAATATFQADIQGLAFGWEPDESHQIWTLDDKSETGFGERRAISEFWINIETFWTHEHAIDTSRDDRLNILLAQSPLKSDRDLAAANTASTPPDHTSNLIRQCRMLLVLLAVLSATQIMLRFG